MISMILVCSAAPTPPSTSNLRICAGSTPSVPSLSDSNMSMYASGTWSAGNSVLTTFLLALFFLGLGKSHGELLPVALSPSSAKRPEPVDLVPGSSSKSEDLVWRAWGGDVPKRDMFVGDYGGQVSTKGMRWLARTMFVGLVVWTIEVETMELSYSNLINQDVTYS